MSQALRAEHVSVKRGAKTLIRDVSVTLEPRELVALVGENGAGKSTLLSALAGEFVTQSGRVTLEGRALTEWDRLELARRRAVLPQRSSLSFALRVEEVVWMGRAPHTARGARYSARDTQVVTRAMEAARVAHLTSRLYPTLSGGEQQRVQLARVLAQLSLGDPELEQTPRWLLLDEPTASLDPARAYDVLEVVSGLRELGVGVCVVLHDLNLAMRYADRVVVMWRSEAVAAGPPREVLTAPLLKEVFGLHAQVAIVEGVSHPVVIPLSAAS